MIFRLRHCAANLLDVGSGYGCMLISMASRARQKQTERIKREKTTTSRQESTPSAHAWQATLATSPRIPYREATFANRAIEAKLGPIRCRRLPGCADHVLDSLRRDPFALHDVKPRRHPHRNPQ